MTYLTEALNVVIDSDQMEVYLAEFRRHQVRQEEIRPMITAALDHGNYQRLPSTSALLSHRPQKKIAGPRVIWGQGGACIKDSLPSKDYRCGCRECRRQDWCAFEGCFEHLTHHSGKTVGLARLGAEGPDYCEMHQSWENREADAQLPVRMPKPPGYWQRRAEELAPAGRAGFKQLLREIAGSPGPLQGVDVGRVMRMKP
jgi:hypothetical protein